MSQSPPTNPPTVASARPSSGFRQAPWQPEARPRQRDRRRLRQRPLAWRRCTTWCGIEEVDHGSNSWSLASSRGQAFGHQRTPIRTDAPSAKPLNRAALCVSGGLRCSIPGIDKLGGLFRLQRLVRISSYRDDVSDARPDLGPPRRRLVVSARKTASNFANSSGSQARGRRAHLALNENPRVGAT